MSGYGRDEKITNWVSDFCDSSAFRDHPSLVQEYAPQVLQTFLEAACAARDVDPGDIEERDLRAALVQHVARIEMAGSARADVPALCASFLGEMQAQGRLAGGESLGRFVGGLKRPFLDAASGKGQTIRGPETKLGRNDPCPCGSGKKYKKCCRGLLD